MVHIAILQKKTGALIKNLRNSTLKGEKYKNPKPKTMNHEL